MNQIDFNITKEKFKHLNEKELEGIIRAYNNFIFSTNAAFRATHNNKHLKLPKRNIGKTEFLKLLASKYNTSLSNIYKIINTSKITILDSNLKYIYE